MCYTGRADQVSETLIPALYQGSLITGTPLRFLLTWKKKVKAPLEMQHRLQNTQVLLVFYLLNLREAL